MDKRVRRMVTACAAALVLLILPATASAAPPVHDGAVGPAWSPGQLVDEVVTWLTGWLDESPPRTVSARGGHSMDPDGAESPDPEDGGTVTTQGGPTMDPNG